MVLLPALLRNSTVLTANGNTKRHLTNALSKRKRSTSLSFVKHRNDYKSAKNAVLPGVSVPKAMEGI